MGDIVAFQHRQARGQTDAVVGTQSSTLRFHPITVNVGTNRIFGEIVRIALIGLRHHIQVRLQRYRNAVFHTGACRLTNQYVTDFIAFHKKPFFLRPVHNKIRQFVFVMRRVGNRTNLLKPLP